MYVPLTEELIEEFAGSYRGGAEERAELLREYKNNEGNMSNVFEWVTLSDPDQDSHRFKIIIDSAIEAGEVKEYPTYKIWATKVAKKKPPPPRGAANTKKEGNSKGAKSKSGPGEGSEGDLMALMAQRQAQRRGAFEAMLSRMTGGEEMPPEPTDEEFEAARRRIENRTEARNKKRSGADGEESGGSGKKKILVG